MNKYEEALSGASFTAGPNMPLASHCSAFECSCVGVDIEKLFEFTPVRLHVLLFKVQANRSKIIGLRDSKAMPVVVRGLLTRRPARAFSTTSSHVYICQVHVRAWMGLVRGGTASGHGRH